MNLQNNSCPKYYLNILIQRKQTQLKLSLPKKVIVSFFKTLKQNKKNMHMQQPKNKYTSYMCYTW